jgi:hypothetical protein
MPGSRDVRGISRHVYGNSYLLEVAAAIAGGAGRDTTQKKLAELTGLERNVVAQVVKRLEAAELLQRVAGQGREQPLRPAQSVFWDLAAAHLEEARRRHETSG